MGYIEKKPGVYFLMADKEPNIDSFLRMAHELTKLGFDDDKFQRVMILNPYQMRSFLSSLYGSGLPLPSHETFHEWTFVGFMLRTLTGKIE